MGEYYSELASVLQERLEVISDQDLRTKDPEAQLRRLHLASERIDRLKQGLPADADPILKHFLERRRRGQRMDLVAEASLKDIELFVDRHLVKLALGNCSSKRTNLHQRSKFVANSRKVGLLISSGRLPRTARSAIVRSTRPKIAPLDIGER